MNAGLIDIFSTIGRNTIYPWLRLPSSCLPHEHLNPSAPRRRLPSSHNGALGAHYARCPNPKGAMKFLDIVGRAEYQALFARLMYYAPQNPKALDLLEPEIARLMPTYPDNEKVAHMVNFEWWADNLPAMQRRFQQWLQT